MTPKERKFCLAYAKKPNTEKAAEVAGYSAYYSRKKAQFILRRPHVIAEIKRLRERMNERAEKSATDVVNEFSKIAFSDHVSFLKEDPEFPGSWIYKSPDELTDDQRIVVVDTHIHTQLIKVKGGKEKIRETYSYEFADKVKALEQMGRHYGLFTDKLKIGMIQKNPFSNISPEQLEKLKASFVTTMNEPALIEDGEVVDG